MVKVETQAYPKEENEIGGKKYWYTNQELSS
jgi:hypothetical protein